MASTFDFSTVDTTAKAPPTPVTSTTKTAAPNSATEQSDRFLKLLVTQMQNQDPLNPMDNAQITTQMAQISTVTGIDDLNKSITSMNTMLLQSQSLEAASLVGKNVLVPGKELQLAKDGSTAGGFELAGPADQVNVKIYDQGGKLIDTVKLGAVDQGRHGFTWKSPDANATGLTFEVSATNGGVAVGSTALVADTVGAVYTEGGQLKVETLKHGIVAYSDVKAVS
ncbi:flagellar hook assembly protein FlgD [Aquabacterium sp.]|uniref:flagellar hook assembly protein FlgD n=1 Tax=Aquabacterium sp. TaxID=1872578 RepID=UPI0037840B8B